MSEFQDWMNNKTGESKLSNQYILIIEKKAFMIEGFFIKEVTDYTAIGAGMDFALSALWQQWRDEAAWVNTSSESELNRAHNLAIAALERSTDLDLQDADKTSKLIQVLGKFGIKTILGK